MRQDQLLHGLHGLFHYMFIGSTVMNSDRSMSRDCMSNTFMAMDVFNHHAALDPGFLRWVNFSHSCVPYYIKVLHLYL